MINKQFNITKKGFVRDMNRSFDLAYWQNQSAADRMAAIWEMTVFHHKLKKRDPDELRLNRTIACLKPREY